MTSMETDDKSFFIVNPNGILFFQVFFFFFEDSGKDYFFSLKRSSRYKFS